MGKGKSIRQFIAFKELVSFKNSGTNLEAFLRAWLRAWQIKAARVEENGLDLPEELKAHMLLAAADFSDARAESVLMQIEAH